MVPPKGFFIDGHQMFIRENLRGPLMPPPPKK